MRWFYELAWLWKGNRYRALFFMQSFIHFFAFGTKKDLLFKRFKPPSNEFERRFKSCLIHI